MRKVMQEPGFWMMVFGTIILAMFLFVGNGNCAERVGIVYTVEISTDCSGSGYGIGTGGNPWPSLMTTKTKCQSKYRHYMGTPGQKPLLVGVTEQPPSMMLLPVLLAKYEQLMGD
jgi:hypothetical protein